MVIVENISLANKISNKRRIQIFCVFKASKNVIYCSKMHRSQWRPLHAPVPVTFYTT